MAIDWPNEDFARLYKRETDDDLLLSWEALAVWHMFLKRCDKSGLLETKRGVRGLAALLRIPHEVIERVLQELLEDGRLRSIPHHGFMAPNYVNANYVARSDKARKAHSRLTQRVTGASEKVTGRVDGQHGDGVDCDESDRDDSEFQDDGSDRHGADMSHDVTGSHAESQFSQSINQSINQHSAAPRGRARSRCAIPPDWKPRARELELATSLGLDANSEAREFLDYWLGDGRAKADWDQTFAARLQAQARGRRRGKQEEVRDVQDM